MDFPIWKKLSRLVLSDAKWKLILSEELKSIDDPKTSIEQEMNTRDF